MIKMEIELGDKVKCKLTGFRGTAVAKTEYINGCIQYTILSKITKASKTPEELNVDEQSLELIKAKEKKKRRKETGGMGRNY